MTDPLETRAPERIWAWTSGQAAGIFDTSYHDNAGSAVEYIRADLVAALVAEAVAQEKARIVQIIHEHCGTWHGEPVYLDLVEDDLDQFFAAIRARSET